MDSFLKIHCCLYLLYRTAAAKCCFMKHLFVHCCLLLLLVATTGCPYEADVPLDDPSVPIPIQLPGTWVNADDSMERVIITAADAYRFNISYYSDTTGAERFSAHLSLLRQTWFLNLKPLGSVRGLRGPYAFYRFDLSPNGNRITLTPVTENITERFNASRQLRRFFLKHMHNSFFYDGDEVIQYDKLQ